MEECVGLYCDLNGIDLLTSKVVHTFNNYNLLVTFTISVIRVDNIIEIIISFFGTIELSGYYGFIFL